MPVGRVSFLLNACLGAPRLFCVTSFYITPGRDFKKQQTPEPQSVTSKQKTPGPRGVISRTEHRDPPRKEHPGPRGMNATKTSTGNFKRDFKE